MRINTLIAATALSLCAVGSASAFQLNNTHGWGVTVVPSYYKVSNSRQADDARYYGIRPFYQVNRYFNVGLLLGFDVGHSQQPSGQYTGFTSFIETAVNMPIFNGWRVIPKFFFGLGAMKVNQGTSAAADIGFGLSYHFSQMVSAGVDYRTFHQFSDNSPTDHLISMDITWRFGQGNAQQAMATAKPLTATQKNMLANAKQSLRYVLPHGVYRCSGSNRDLYSGCVTFDGKTMVMHLYTQFKINQHKVEPYYIKDVSRLVSFMKQHSSIKVELKGYASDYSGTHDYNQWLSEKRSHAVQQYMIKHGIAKDRLVAIGYGANTANQLYAPLTLNLSKTKRLEWQRQMSRRVQAEAQVPTKLVSGK